MSYYNKIKNAAKAIEDNCGKADIAIILGSGLGDYASQLENANSISYSSIPGFPDSTVPGHAGVWHCGTLENKQVYMMQGRFHAYEGYDLQDVTLPIRVMKQLGVKTLIVTNAAGGVNLAFKPGELMLITDCINLSGKNPLIGPNLDEFGPRFPDMSEAFSKNYRNIAEKVAVTNGIKLHKGVYAWLNGPCFETPAEIRMCRAL
ncbi:MAG: purine-nucleoside phosphorylase, partial [Christensenellaceae bacterium]|nr:purine-nucleoside phosphorylase [Christensenellaceae bacterium]